MRVEKFPHNQANTSFIFQTTIRLVKKLMHQYLILGGLWLGYGLVHSLLAAHFIKNKIQNFSPFLKQYYRLIYNLIASILLFLLLAYQFQMPSPLLWKNTLPQKIIGVLMMVGGVFLLKASFKSYNLAEFLGIKAEPPQAKFSTSGLLQYVRHPLYSATLLLLWGVFLFQNNVANLILALCLSLYLYIGIEIEEAKLIQIFGEKYITYRKKVPKLLPKL